MWCVKCWETDRYVKFYEYGTFMRVARKDDASRFEKRIEAEYALQNISLTTGYVTQIT